MPRNARKRRLKRKHGNVPAKARPWETIKKKEQPAKEEPEKEKEQPT